MKFHNKHPLELTYFISPPRPLKCHVHTLTTRCRYGGKRQHWLQCECALCRLHIAQIWVYVLQSDILGREAKKVEKMCAGIHRMINTWHKPHSIICLCHMRQHGAQHRGVAGGGKGSIDREEGSTEADPVPTLVSTQWLADRVPIGRPSSEPKQLRVVPLQLLDGSWHKPITKRNARLVCSPILPMGVWASRSLRLAIGLGPRPYKKNKLAIILFVSKKWVGRAVLFFLSFFLNRYECGSENKDFIYFKTCIN